MFSPPSPETLDRLYVPAVIVLIAMAWTGWFRPRRDKAALPLLTRILGGWRMRRKYRGLDKRWGERECEGRAGKAIGGGL